jgi:hypothetical protein
MNNTTAAHDHYPTTEIDLACDLCRLALAFRPLVDDSERVTVALDNSCSHAVDSDCPHYS